MKCVYGQVVYRPFKTSCGWYVEMYKVSEQTGREVEMVTVVPRFCWPDVLPKGGVWTSIQVPANELCDMEGLVKLIGAEPLHPAMTL